MTWKEVRSWTSEYYDDDYSVLLPNPNRATISKKVSEFFRHFYILKGSEILYIIMGAGKGSDETFQFVKIFPLDKLSGFTKQENLQHQSLTNLFLNGSAFHSEFTGETFFFEDPRGSYPFVEAFTVRYPKGRSARFAIEFSNRVKENIFAAKA